MDNKKNILKAIPREYKGVEYRSTTESKVAEIFDKYGTKFIYEPEGYSLNGMLYIPDFYLPEIKTFVEVKGPTNSDLSKPKALLESLRESLTEDEKRDWWWLPKYMVVIIYSDGHFISACDSGEQGNAKQMSDQLCFATCFKCNKKYFVHSCRGYNCKACGHYEGGSLKNALEEFNLFTNQRQYKFK
jgi:hypothetical protein